MSNYDGSIIIDTQLDTSSLEKDLSKLTSSLQGNIKGLGTAISKPFDSASKSVTANVANITKTLGNISKSLSSIQSVITKSFTASFSSASKSAASSCKTITDTIKSVGTNTSGVASKISKNVIQPFLDIDRHVRTSVDGTKQSFGTLGAILEGASAGYEAVSTSVEILSTVMKVQDTVTKLFGITTAASTVATGAQAATTAGATTAQWSLNAAMTANPIGVVVVAVAALVGALAGLIAIMNKGESAYSREMEYHEQERKKIEEKRQAIKDLNEEAQKKIAISDKETGVLKNYMSVLDKQVDQEGNIAGSKAEVQLAIDKINDAMGRTVVQIDGEKVKWLENKDAIMENIEAKRINNMLDIAKPNLENAYKEEQNACRDAGEALLSLNGIKQSIANKESEILKRQQEIADQYGITLEDVQKKTDNYVKFVGDAEDRTIIQLSGQINKEKLYLQERQKTYDEKLAIAQNYTSTIAKYQQAEVALAEGNYAKSSELLNSILSERKNYNQMTKEELQNEYDIINATLTNLTERQKQYPDEVSQATIDGFLKNKSDLEAAATGMGLTIADNTFNGEVMKKTDEKAEAIVDYTGEQLYNNSPKLVDSGTDMGKVTADATYNGYDGQIKQYDFGQTPSEKITSDGKAVTQASGDVGNKSALDFGNEYNNQLFKTHLALSQPVENASDNTIEISKEGGQKAGREYAQGIIEGVQEKTGEVAEAIKTMAQTVESNSNEAVKTIAKPLGGALVNGIELGATDQQGPLNSKIQQIVRNAIEAGRIEADVNSPSKVTRDEIGRPLVEGLIKGIGLEQKNLNKSMGGLLNNMLKSGKNTMGIHSPSTVMRDEIGAQIDRGIEVGIKENSKEVLEEFDNLLDALKDKRELNIISEEEYHTQLEALTRKHLDENSKEWRQHMMEVYQYQQETYEKSIKAAEDAYTKIADTAKKKLDEITKAQDEFKKKMTGGSLVGSVYSEADGSKTLTGTYLNDPNYDARAMTAYAEQIKKIQGLAGDNAGFISQILREMDLATGQQFLNTLLNMDPAKLDAFLKGLTENAVAKINSMENSEKLNFADMLFYMFGTDKKSAAQMIVEQMAGIASEADAAQTLADLLWGPDNAQLQAETENSFYEEYGQSLPADFWQFGEDAAANFAKSFVDKTSSQESQAEIKAAGETAGSAFAAGVSESLSKETMKAELEQSFSSVPDDFFAIGQDSANSFCEGFMEKLQSAFAAIQNAVTAGMQSMAPSLALAGGFAAGSVSTYHNNYNFYGSGQDSTVSIFKC